MVCMIHTVANAQQQSVVNLIVRSFNEAHQGFPSLIRDTLPDFGGWNYKIKPEVVQQFAEVKDIKMNIKKNHKSLLMNDTLVQLNQLRIRSATIQLGANKKWNDYKDTLTAYYNNIVGFFKQAFGKQLNYTAVIPLEDPKDADFKPRYLVYFYEKYINLPETLTNRYEIEKQLDVVAWFTVELQENMMAESNYNFIYRISGGQKLEN
jgi:hypothetical protein